MSVYLFTPYLFWPFHALWKNPTWMQKMIFALFLCWMAFSAILIASNKSVFKKDKQNNFAQ